MSQFSHIVIGIGDWVSVSWLLSVESVLIVMDELEELYVY